MYDNSDHVLNSSIKSRYNLYTVHFILFEVDIFVNFDKWTQLCNYCYNQGTGFSPTLLKCPCAPLWSISPLPSCGQPLTSVVFLYFCLFLKCHVSGIRQYGAFESGFSQHSAFGIYSFFYWCVITHYMNIPVYPFTSWRNFGASSLLGFILGGYFMNAALDIRLLCK